MSLKNELKAEKVCHLDLSGFCQVSSGSTIKKVLTAMQTQGHNVCLVTAKNTLIGIVTNHDILRNVVGKNRLNDAIDDIMTENPVTVTPEFSAADALWLMDRKNVRNLPVVAEDGKIAGNMTHQSVIQYLASRYPAVVLNLPPRPEHYAANVEGGD